MNSLNTSLLTVHIVDALIAIHKLAIILAIKLAIKLAMIFLDLLIIAILIIAMLIIAIPIPATGNAVRVIIVGGFSDGTIGRSPIRV